MTSKLKTIGLGFLAPIVLLWLLLIMLGELLLNRPFRPPCTPKPRRLGPIQPHGAADICVLFAVWLLTIAAMIISCRGQTFEEAQDSARTELVRRHLLMDTVLPTWSDVAATNPPMTTSLPGDVALVRVTLPPVLETNAGLLYVRFDGKPRRMYYLQSRNLTSQTWKTVSPQFPAAMRTGFPFYTNTAQKYYRIQEGELVGTNFTYKVMATLTNK